MLKNLSTSLTEYEKIKEMKLYDLIGYLDILEKQERFDKIEEMNEKINKIEQQFSAKPPKM